MSSADPSLSLPHQSHTVPLATPPYTSRAAKLPRARSRSSLRMVNAPFLSTEPPHRHFHIRRRFALIYANFFLPFLVSKLVTSSLRGLFVSIFRYVDSQKKRKWLYPRIRIRSTDSSSRERGTRHDRHSRYRMKEKEIQGEVRCDEVEEGGRMKPP